jgi:8-oxo-dGTP pyrophosphatase MutT (NUDIX family)
MGDFVEYTDPAALTTGVEEGWAEPVTDPSEIDWPARQARAAIPFEVVDGRPVNPCEKTRVRRGRNGLGWWGENLMADAVVTCHVAGVSWLLLIEREDGYGWAVPGGGVDPGEAPAAAAARELGEETGLVVSASLWRAGEATYVPDPRASDEAWAVTVPAYADLGVVDRLPEVCGSDDARRAKWVRAGSFEQVTSNLTFRFDGVVFPAHVELLRGFFADRPQHGYYVVYATTPDDGLQRFGAVSVALPFELTCDTAVRQLTNQIAYDVCAPVVVTNWLPLKEVA